MSPRTLVWQSLALTPPLEPAAVEAALAGLCSLSGAPIITLEARGADGLVTWRLGCDATDLARVRDVLRAHIPALYFPRATGRATDADRAARVRLAGSQRRPFAPKDVEPITRSVLGALSRASRGESLALQVTLGPRRRPRVIRKNGEIERIDYKASVEKHRDPRFTIDVRVGATAERSDRVRSLINSVIASLRGLEVPGVRVSATHTSTDGFISASLPWFWRSHLTPRELVALTAWPLAEQMPGIPSPHPRRLHPSPAIPKTGLVLGHAVDDPTRPIALRLADAPRALHLIGPPGVGKSTLIASAALQEITAGRGVIVIDPKGDLVTEVLARIPARRLDDVALIDPRDEAPVGIGSLQGDPDRTADGLLAVFRSLYPENFGIRSSDILHGTLLTLARRGDASLVMIPTLLTNPGFRRSVVGRLVREDPMGLGAFWGWYEGLSEPERQQAIAPVLSKLRPILLRPDMRHTLGQRAPRFTLSDVFTKKKILIVNVARGQLGPEASMLLGSVLVSLLADAVMARANVAQGSRSPVMFFIDEFQDYVRFGGGDFGEALAQFRGLGASLVLGHQHMAQLSPALRDAVVSNARTRVMFGLGHRDAADFARMSRGLVEGIDLETLPAYEAYASLFVDGAAVPWVSLKTVPLGPPTTDPDLVRARSRANYGVSGTETDEYLNGLVEPPSPPTERFGRTPRPSGGAS
jgi:hypothetical protein